MTTDPTSNTARYRKKPIPVEARQVPPSSDGQSGLELAAWCGGSVSGTYAEPKIFVPTLEGELVARVGDWIVKGTRGEFWPVKGDIFAETYESADIEPADPAAGGTVPRVIALYKRWVMVGAPPLGTSVSRWWDARLIELQDAIRPAAEAQQQPAAEAPAVDPAERRDRYAAAMAKRDGDSWPTQYEGDEVDYRRRAAAAITVADAEQAELRRERDLAITHDRQPYPTAWAYEQACKALNRKTDVIDQVRAMHRRRTERHGSGCVQCGMVWPCPTYKALDLPSEAQQDGAQP